MRCYICLSKKSRLIKCSNKKCNGYVHTKCFVKYLHINEKANDVCQVCKVGRLRVKSKIDYFFDDSKDELYDIDLSDTTSDTSQDVSNCPCFEVIQCQNIMQCLIGLFYKQ